MAENCDMGRHIAADVGRGWLWLGTVAWGGMLLQMWGGVGCGWGLWHGEACCCRCGEGLAVAGGTAFVL